MPESVVLQGVTSSMIGSFCPDTTFSALFISGYTLPYASAINSKFGNGLHTHVIPGFHTPYTIVDVSLRQFQHLWLTSTVP